MPEKNDFTWEALPFCSEGKDGLVKSLEKRNKNLLVFWQHNYKEEANII